MLAQSHMYRMDTTGTSPAKAAYTAATVFLTQEENILACTGMCCLLLTRTERKPEMHTTSS